MKNPRKPLRKIFVDAENYSPRKAVGMSYGVNYLAETYLWSVLRTAPGPA